MRKISITEALNELKLYDAKINKAISNAELIGAAKKSLDKVGVVKKDTFIEKAKSSYQSVTDLIANRNALKSAIVKSNAITEVTVNGKTMTVAEVIERKNSIDYEITLLNEMKRQYVKATDTVTKENKRVDNKVDELIQTLVGKDTDKKIDKDAIENIEAPYRAKNEYELVDPIGLSDKIAELESDISGFESNCDTTLAVANATTFVELDF
jgi:hypothetical protein